jgi:hypothetical protein
VYLLEGVGEALLHQSCPSLGDLPAVREVHPTYPWLQCLGLGQMVGSTTLTCLGGYRPMKYPGRLLQDIIQLMWAAFILVILLLLVNQILMIIASKSRFCWGMLEFVD